MLHRPGSRKGAWFARDVLVSTGSTGERVLLHLPTSTYLLLDDAAARIVDLLTEDPYPDHAAAALARRFDIPYDQALGDVSTVVDAVRGLSIRRVDRGRRPTLGGARAVGQAWLRQPWETRWVILRAGAAIGIAEVGLTVTSLPRLAGLMRVPLAADRDFAVAEADNFGSLDALTPREQQAHWAVDWVLERWLFDGTCLRRSLAFGWFIRRRRPVLRLGMIDDGGTVAHAWVEAEGRVFDAAAVTGSFMTPARRDPADGHVDNQGDGHVDNQGDGPHTRGADRFGVHPDVAGDRQKADDGRPDVPDGGPFT